jgi:hypothetical protein
VVAVSLVVIALQEEAIHLLVRFLVALIRAKVQVEVEVQEEEETEAVIIHVPYQGLYQDQLRHHLLIRIDRNVIVAKIKNIIVRLNVTVRHPIQGLIRLDQPVVEDQQHLRVHHLHKKQSHTSLNESHLILHRNIAKNLKSHLTTDLGLIHIPGQDQDLLIITIIITKNHQLVIITIDKSIIVKITLIIQEIIIQLNLIIIIITIITQIIKT